tara:strand:+ start:872 stop:1534 length:663 start_codon:yes stop_codon:yes gene_type:complete
MSLSFSQLSPNAGHIIAKFALATTEEVVSGQQWYKSAHEIASRLARNNNITTAKAAGILAALSPNNKWERNCLDAERLIQAYIHGDEDDARNINVCTYGAMKEKAIKILNLSNDLGNYTHKELYEFTDIIEILNGPKIIEFYNCIMQRNDVCIDGHAYSIWFGERMTMKQVPNIGKRLRERIKSDYLDATSWINEEMQTNYLPSDIQAITWICHKRIYKI